MLRAAQRVQHLCIVAAQTRAYKVCIVDPRTVLTDPEAALQGSGAVTIDVPDAFVDKLSAGTCGGVRLAARLLSIIT